jgi:hypothetical protein
MKKSHKSHKYTSCKQSTAKKREEKKFSAITFCSVLSFGRRACRHISCLYIAVGFSYKTRRQNSGMCSSGLSVFC